MDMASPGVSGCPECGRRGEGAGVGSQAPQLALDTHLHQECWAASSSDGLPVQLSVACGPPLQALPLPPHALSPPYTHSSQLPQVSGGEGLGHNRVFPCRQWTKEHSYQDSL